MRDAQIDTVRGITRRKDTALKSRQLPKTGSRWMMEIALNDRDEVPDGSVGMSILPTVLIAGRFMHCQRLEWTTTEKITKSFQTPAI